MHLISCLFGLFLSILLLPSPVRALINSYFGLNLGSKTITLANHTENVNSILAQWNANDAYTTWFSQAAQLKPFAKVPPDMTPINRVLEEAQIVLDSLCDGKGYITAMTLPRGVKTMRTDHDLITAIQDVAYAAPMIIEVDEVRAVTFTGDAPSSASSILREIVDVVLMGFAKARVLDTIQPSEVGALGAARMARQMVEYMQDEHGTYTMHEEL